MGMRKYGVQIGTALFRCFASKFSMTKLDTEGAVSSFGDAIVMGDLACESLQGGNIAIPYVLTAALTVDPEGARAWFVIPVASKLIRINTIVNDAVGDATELGIYSYPSEVKAASVISIGAAATEDTIDYADLDYTDDGDRRVGYLARGSSLSVVVTTGDSGTGKVQIVLELERLMGGGQNV